MSLDSYKRVFNQRLENVPFVVLSNNDGCAIGRSQEAKALGIKMGAPYFLIHDIRFMPATTRLKVPPFCEYGQPGDIMKPFGAPSPLREAVTQLQTLLYAA